MIKLDMGKKEQILTELLNEANQMPKQSGCYLFKNSEDVVLYIGKAKILRNRVRSYFSGSNLSVKNQIMISKVRSIGFFVTQTDAESYILENNLIKEHRPKYNIGFRDDKTYPYIRIDLNHSFPRLEYLRKPKKKQKQKILGPYPVGSGIFQVLKKITEVYQLRDCSDSDFKSRKRPCLLYQMKKCTAPCVGYIDEESYREDLNQAWNFFNGKGIKKTFSFLKEKMLQLSDDEKFEEASMTRDLINELEGFVEEKYDQNVELSQLKNLDIIGVYRGEVETDISFYQVRRGLLLGYENFHFLNIDIGDDFSDFLESFIFQYFEKMEFNRAEKIVCDESQINQNHLSNILNEAFENNVNISKPRGEKERGLFKATTEHAKQMQIVRDQKNDSVYSALTELQRILNLKERPKLLECYDVAVWQGKSPTASQVVFFEGRADKKLYRYYHLEERPEGNNDFAMMKEVLERRLKHGGFPDIFIVDGGRAQLNVFKKLLEEKELNIPVVGIAKAKNHNESEERLIVHNRINPYLLKRHKGLLNLLVAMRDEAHRFSRKLHHKQENKRIMVSWVDRVPNLKYDIRQKIKSNLSYSTKEIKKLSVIDLVNAFQISIGDAKRIYHYAKRL